VTTETAKGFSDYWSAAVVFPRPRDHVLIERARPFGIIGRWRDSLHVDDPARETLISLRFP
jgi:hypothetical protein